MSKDSWLRVTLIALLLSCLSCFLQEAAAKGSQEQSKIDLVAVSDIQRELKQVQDSLSEVRRDQLNYQIEKNLLKETYSSNFQTINIVLTLVLGAFTIFGYVGLKNVGELRDAFEKELREYRDMKKELELQLASLKEEQAIAKTKVNQLAEKNEEQDRRLKLMEIQEKVAELSQNRQYRRALEYVNIGLDLSPENVTLLLYQGNCLSKHGRLVPAKESYLKALKLDPSATGAILNLGEIYALLGTSEDFNDHMKAHGDVVYQRSPFLPWCLTAVHLWSQGNVKALVAHAKTMLDKIPEGKTVLLKNWRFDEILEALSKKKHPATSLMASLVDLMRGQIDKAKLMEILSTFETT